MWVHNEKDGLWENIGKSQQRASDQMKPTNIGF